MPVVINEFEILTEPPPPPAPDGSPPAAPPVAPTPHDIDRALRRRVERWTRIRAH